MQYPTVSVNGVSVRVDDEGRYSLNDLHAAAVANGEATESQRPSVFLRSAQVKRFIKALQSKALKSASEQNQPLKVTKGGDSTGAWGVELLAIRYAAWIKPEFEIEVYEVFRTVVRMGIGAMSRLNKIEHIINTETKVISQCASQMAKWGVSPLFFPLFMDSAGNVPVYWNGGLDASAIATGLLEKIWTYINGIIANALNQNVPLVSPGFVPGMMDAAGNVPFWFQDGELDATGIGPNIRGIFSRWYQRRMYTSAYNIPLHTDGRTLWRWKAKKAQLKAGLATRPHFMLTGDSWTQNNELATAIAGLLHDDYGDAGLGWRTVNYGAARDGSNINRSAGWNLYDSSPTSGAPLYGCGIDGQSVNTTMATDYFRVTNIRCTDCRIYYQDLNGRFQYGYDAGGITQWTEVVCGNTGATKSVLLTGMADEVRTIYIKTDGNMGRVAIHGFYLWRSGVAGCVMSKAGNSGILADQFLLFSDKIAEYLSTMQPDVIAIVIGNNDYRISESTAIFRTALQTYMAACRAVLPDVGFILMAPPRTNGTAITPIVDFRDVMYDLSQSLNCEFFSIYDLFDTWAEMNSLGCFLDNLHPNATGSNLVATSLYNALIKG